MWFRLELIFEINKDLEPLSLPLIILCFINQEKGII